MTKNRHQNIVKDVEHKRTGNLEQTKKKSNNWQDNKKKASSEE